MRKRLLAVLFALTIIFVLFLTVSAASSICFVGLNDSVPMYLSANEAPYYKGNALYVPYTVFQAGPGGIAVSYNTDKGNLVLFTRAKRLVYDLNAGTVTDEAQKVGIVDVVYRNGILFIPVTRAANHFGFTATMLKSAGGSPVLRFTDGSQTLDNSTFVRKAETLISIILEQEEKNTLSDGDRQNGAEEKEEENNAAPATVYLAFAGEAVSRQTLETLRTMRVSGTFFLTEQQIREDRNLVREIFAQGHQIGLTVEAGGTDYVSALRTANEALDHVIFMKSVMLLLPPGVQSVPGYITFKEQVGATIDNVLEDTAATKLFVCRADAVFTLQRLLQEGAHVPKLLETTRIPGVTIN